MAEEEEKQEKSGGGNTLLIILIVVLFIFVLALGGAVAWLIVSQKSSDEKGGEKPAQHASAEHGSGEEGNPHAKQYSPKYKQFDPPPPDQEPLYFEMKPFVVNFHGDGKAKYLAVTLKFMTYYPQLVGEHGELEHLRPILRDRITILLRSQHYNDLVKDDGPDRLREEILKVAKEVLDHHGIYPDLLEGVYFERFVMQ